MLATTVMVLALASLVPGLPASQQLYQFGPHVGDNSLPRGDDFSSSPVHLASPIPYFGDRYETIYVNTNGLLSLMIPLAEYHSVQFPLEYLVVAPFYSNVDTSSLGNVWYRETTEDEMSLTKHRARVSKAFPDVYYQPVSLFIATWDHVGHSNSTSQVNTFQAVLGTDGEETFLELVYAEDGVQWAQTWRGRPEARAQAGLVSHDGRLTLLPGSGSDSILHLDKMSNMGMPGVFMFRVGKIDENENAEQPPDHSPDGMEAGMLVSCETGYLTCHSEARCLEREDGVCCACHEGFFGNGKQCLKQDSALRANGRVSLSVNGVREEQVYLQAYIVPEEGASYTAVTSVPPQLGNQMQLLEVLGTTLGWLFAKPVSGAPNGYQLTGGVLNHTTEIRFSSGQALNVKQRFFGLDIFDQLRLEVEISGTLPPLPYGADLTLRDFQEIYTRTQPGVLRSVTDHVVRVGGRGLELIITKTQEVDYQEACPGYDNYHDNPFPQFSTLKLKSSKHVLKYTPEEKVLRFASYNRISTNKEGEDPCLEGQVTCVANSSCLVEEDSFRCVCNPGFQTYGEGSDFGCVDTNECEEGSSNCHEDAICVNEVGTFHCQCKPGYQGDGTHCAVVPICEDNPESCQPAHGYCHDPAEVSTCKCNHGFWIEIVDGRVRCEDVDECREAQPCHHDAVCTNFDGGFECTCKEGFIGDGAHCHKPECDEYPEQCQISNGICEDPTNYETCRCNKGFRLEVTVDGPSCLDVDECRESGPCHEDADCYNTQGSYECRCRSSFYGDGFSCYSVEGGRCEDMRCWQGSHCEQDFTGPTCVCDSGYIGTPPDCRQIINEECRSRRDCGENADCLYQGVSGELQCICDEGYEGDGRTCHPASQPFTISPTRRPESSRFPSGEFTVKTCHEGDCWCPPEYIEQGDYCVRTLSPGGGGGVGGGCARLDCPADSHCVQGPSGAECRCNSGLGTPPHCSPQVKGSCRSHDDCSPHAQCMYLSHLRAYDCLCNAGYEGDGFVCNQLDLSCMDSEICDANASCRYDSTSDRHICICNEGFLGDGSTCYASDECTSPAQCGENEACLFNSEKGVMECACPEGYRRDTGGICRYYGYPQGCGECHEYARCDDYSECVCLEGYTGDGVNSCLPEEQGCHLVNNCSPYADCVALGQRFQCICQEGYEGDGYECASKENCVLQPDMCDVNAVCQRLQDDYLCRCTQGFIGNGTFCKEVKEIKGGFLLVNQGRSTLQVPFEPSPSDRGRPIHLHSDQVLPIGITVDCIEGRVYWSDVFKKAIHSSNYDGSDLQDFTVQELDSSEGLAVDWVNRHLYWTDSGRDTISRASLDTRQQQVLVSDGLSNPRGIAVHPWRREVYWSDWERSGPKLERAGLDGRGRRTLVKAPDVQLPNSLAIDWVSDELCWADAGTHSIQCLRLASGGRERRTAVKDCQYPFGLAITPQKYYWTDWRTNKIESADKSSGQKKSLEMFFGGGDKLYGVVAVEDSCPS